MLLELLAELCVTMRTKDYGFLEVSMKFEKNQDEAKPLHVLKRSLTISCTNQLTRLAFSLAHFLGLF